MRLEEATTREKIIKVLRKSIRPLTAEEIAGELGNNVTVKDVYEHMVHVARSLRAKSGGQEILVMEPPYCKKCGYVFKDLGRPRRPSRCPRCKSEWIASPRFAIVRRD